MQGLVTAVAASGGKGIGGERHVVCCQRASAGRAMELELEGAQGRGGRYAVVEDRPISRSRTVQGFSCGPLRYSCPALAVPADGRRDAHKRLVGGAAAVPTGHDCRLAGPWLRW